MPTERGAREVAFLQWALPRMGLEWRGFRRVRRQVLRRIRKRVRELGLADVTAYRAHLESHAEEWQRLEPLCRVTISRFFRDRAVFEALRDDVLPALADGRPVVRALSVGCASGEEPYTLALLDHFASPGAPLSILALDANPHLLERAAAGRYPAGALRELPPAWVADAFVADGDEMRLREAIRARVRFEVLDVRNDRWPPGHFELVLCRNLAFTYFDEAGRRRTLEHIVERLAPRGALVLGGHEALPEDERLALWHRSIYRRVHR